MDDMILDDLCNNFIAELRTPQLIAEIGSNLTKYPLMIFIFYSTK